MRRTMRLVASCLILCACVQPLFGAVPAAGPDEVSSDSTIAGRLLTENGTWRSKAQQMFDPVEKTLVRRRYTVWDPEPSRDLDFAWAPDSLAEDREGVINGRGRLIWRLRDRPAYDPDSVFAEFHGTIKSGRAHGRGRYSELSGLAYDGGWINGVMEGYGRLRLPNADEYVGMFRAGKANGIGRYVDVTGEIFEGPFLNGRRDGRGTTRLPDGTSYQSTWAAGAETEGSRAVRLSQVGGARPPAGSDEVRVAVALPQPSPYEASGSGPVLSIGPGEDKVKIWKADGDIASGQANMLRFGLDASSGLRLRIGIQNRSTRTVQVTGVLFDVQSSASDLQPALQAQVGRQNVCGNGLYGPTVQFWNFGWSAAEEATLRLAFTSPTSTETPSRLDHAKRLGRIDKIAEVDLEPELAAAGVNTALLRSRADRTLSCRAKDARGCVAELKASGIFGSLAALITEEPAIRTVGKLEYDWTDASGNKRKRSSRVEGMLQLGNLTPPPTACAEDATPETPVSRPVSFRLDQAQYRLPTGIPSRAIPAGRTNWLNVGVAAERSSQHEFRVVVQMADGSELTSRPVRLLYYVPSQPSPN